ncbi:phosphatase PAP2 family protein [Actinophytocola sp.]|uniref:phosphatase PAP2 family protein n=1 Tax=Actinophytocola sp. TaxID=1872138 RepID=UPI003D6A1DD2
MTGDPSGARGCAESGDARPVPALPERARVLMAIVATLAAIAVTVLGVAFAGTDTGTAFDTSVQSGLWRLGSPWREIGRIVDVTAEPVGIVPVLACVMLVLRALGHRRGAVLALAGTAASVAVTTALKPVVGRDINNGFLAFPSGHTATATSIALVCALAVLHRHRVGPVTGVLLAAAIVIPAAVAMGWAQVLENSHYPTDTVGGFCVALVMVPLTGRLIDVVADRWAGHEH